MASSRLERIGTIYSRITGLLRSGAMKYEDRPLWYEVYEAFPPRNQAPSSSTEPLPKILYPEDNIRAKFQKLPISKETYRLEDTSKTKCQKFIAEYQSLEQEHKELSQEDLFSMTVTKLESQWRPEAKPFDKVTDLEENEPAMSPLAAAFKHMQNRQQQYRAPVKKVDIQNVFDEDK